MAEDAVEALRLMFARYGLSQLADWISSQVIAGRTYAQISVDIYDQDAYKAAFPAMEALRRAGKVISEAEYRQVEQGYQDVLSYAGLAGSVHDRRDTYTRLIESQVSVRELEERVNDAQMVANATDPNVRRALRDFYGISESDLMSFALDPKGHGKDHVERLARSATLRGIARSTQVAMTSQYAESLAMDPVFDNSTEADIRQKLSDVASFSKDQKRLAGLDGDRFADMDAADILIRGDQRKAREARDRAGRERARWSGSSGTSTGTFGGSRI